MHAVHTHKRKMHTKFWFNSLRTRNHLEVLLNFGGIECGDVDWIFVAKDRDQWPAPVSLVGNLQVP